MEQISLKSKNGSIITVDSTILKHSVVLSARLQEMRTAENNTVSIIRVPEVEEEYLIILVEWMNRQNQREDVPDSENVELPNNQEQSVASPKISKKLDSWEKQFFQTHRKQAFRLMAAANKLEIKDFLQMFGRLLYNWVSNKTVDNIRELVCRSNRNEEADNFVSSDSISSSDLSPDAVEITF